MTSLDSDRSASCWHDRDVLSEMTSRPSVAHHRRPHTVLGYRPPDPVFDQIAITIIRLITAGIGTRSRRAHRAHFRFAAGADLGLMLGYYRCRPQPAVRQCPLWSELNWLWCESEQHPRERGIEQAFLHRHLSPPKKAPHTTDVPVGDGCAYRCARYANAADMKALQSGNLKACFAAQRP